MRCDSIDNLAQSHLCDIVVLGSLSVRAMSNLSPQQIAEVARVMENTSATGQESYVPARQIQTWLENGAVKGDPTTLTRTTDSMCLF